MRCVMMAALAALAVPAIPVAANAQGINPVVALCPAGDVTRVRISKLKPGASMADFDAAVAAHVAWYKERGYKIEQIVAPVYVWVEGKPTIAKDEVMTFASGDNVPRAKQDDGWAAFVAKYRAVSDITIDREICMPKHN
ncbi:hypothetical protein [Porphyrobacter sp. AAP82]|uniref:hypothetical protein n=1 Tax=Porphyrobacter sp. AAP82 TaxID=1248917 RepID=UPI000302A2C2|nr:hypothetical protein [Porphyrobacter sp. AAP82]